MCSGPFRLFIGNHPPFVPLLTRHSCKKTCLESVLANGGKKFS